MGEISTNGTYICGSRGVGKSQFINWVLHNGTGYFGAGDLVVDGLESFRVRSGPDGSEQAEDLRAEEVDDRFFHPLIKGTTSANTLRVSPRFRAGTRGALPDFTLVDMPGGAPLNPGRYAKELASLRDSARTVLLFVPYWSVVDGTRRRPASPDFLKELGAWIDTVREAPWDMCYVVLNQFGRNYLQDFDSAPEGRTGQLLADLDADVELLHSLRVGAGGPVLAARRFRCLLDEIDEYARALVDVRRPAGQMLQPLLKEQRGRTVQVFLQNTVIDELFTAHELRALKDEHARSEFDARYRPQLQDPLLYRALKFFPVHDRLSWLPFFLAALRQDVGAARW